MSASNPTHHHAHAPAHAPPTHNDAYPHDLAAPFQDLTFSPVSEDSNTTGSNLPPVNYKFGTSPQNGITNGHHPHHRAQLSTRPRAGSSNNTMGPGISGVSNGHGPIPVPMPMPGSNGTRMNNGGRPFEGPRSPPGSSKNTSHVPCKFYKQGQCQAGAACPFRHSDSADVCKYFQKGNCKFGMRCANEHITGDGKRVNKSAMLNGQGQGMISGPRGAMVAPMSGFVGISQDAYGMPQMGPQGLNAQPDDFRGPASWKNAVGSDVANIGSYHGSMFGSPPADGRLPMSPMQKDLSILDVPLPASFDSQGISQFAKTGPFASSVPARFGFGPSPPSSLPKAAGESTVLRNLRSSAFGDDGLSRAGLGSSPPVSSGIDFSARRPLHSDRFASKQNVLSSSLGTRAPLHVADEWDPTFGHEEDLVPVSLTDLLTPQEKMRRSSRSNADDDSRISQALLNLGSDSGSKHGSPSLGVSPSRYSGIFSRQKSENLSTPSESIGNQTTMNLGFGHVGSPLRNSYFSEPPSASNNDGFVNSPPRQASMSMLSRQLQQTRLQDSAGGNQPTQHPGMTRNVSASASLASPLLTSTTNSLPIPSGNRFDRTISSSSITRSEKIDEEPMDSTGELFAMDDPEDEPATTAGALSGDRRPPAYKRDSGGRWAIGKASPRLGPIGGQRTTSSGFSSSLGKGDGSPWNS